MHAKRGQGLGQEPNATLRWTGGQLMDSESHNTAHGVVNGVRI